MSSELSKLVENSLPYRLHQVARSSSLEAVDIFLNSTVDLLVADTIVVREVCKDALSYELSPSMFPSLLALLDK